MHPYPQVNNLAALAHSMRASLSPPLPPPPPGKAMWKPKGGHDAFRGRGSLVREKKSAMVATW